MFNKIVLIVFGLMTVSLACKNAEQKGNIHISGQIKGCPDGKGHLYRMFTEDSTLTDSFDIKAGVFAFAINDDKTRLANLLLPDGQSSVRFFTEPGNIKLNGEMSNLATLTGTGTKTNDLNAQYYVSVGEQQKQFNALMQEGEKAQSSNDSKALDSLQNKFMALTKDFSLANLEFAQQHNDNLLAPYIAFMIASNDPSVNITPFYNSLNPELKASPLGLQLGQIVKANEATAIGVSAPEFEGMTPDGKILKLSSLKGKITLVDFWASWCAPCRRENPNVTKVYNEYKNKGFQILGFSLDEEKDKWLAAIGEDKLTWPHISDLKGWRSPVVSEYGVKGIPDNFLLDKEGKILARGLRGEGLAAKLKEIIK